MTETYVWWSDADVSPFRVFGEIQKSRKRNREIEKSGNREIKKLGNREIEKAKTQNREFISRFRVFVFSLACFGVSAFLISRFLDFPIFPDLICFPISQFPRFLNFSILLSRFLDFQISRWKSERRKRENTKRGNACNYSRFTCCQFSFMA